MNGVLTYPGRAVIDILYAHRILGLQKHAQAVLGDGFDGPSFERVISLNNRDVFSIVQARFYRWLGRTE